MDKKIIGYSLAVPDNDYKEERTAYIYDTEIEPEHQHQHLVGLIFELMEEELRKRGYTAITRDAMVSNGWAEKIVKHYADRILEQEESSEEQVSTYGEQIFFRIKL